MDTFPPFRLEQAYRERFTPGMFDLSSSSPHALTVRHVLDQAGIAQSALLDAAMDYEPGGGSLALREAVSAQFRAVAPDQVLITAGAGEAIRVVTEAAVSAGDLAVVQRPVYEALRAAPVGAGARVLDWTPSGGLQFDFDALPETSAATAIFLNNPHGPGGSLVRGSYAGPARLVADEVYRPAALFAQRTPSIIDMAEDAVSIGDISKPLGLGGLRIGWIVSRDRRFMRQCASALDYHSASVSALSARVALAALRHFDVHLARHIQRARANLRLLAAFMEQHEGWLEWCPPQAGYTTFPRLRAGNGASTLLERLGARGIFLIDGLPFEAPEHIRVGFGLDQANFAEALTALGDELRATAPSDIAAASAAGDVIVFAKAPVPGLAKTRLAVEVGTARAAELCDAFVRDSIDLAKARARHLYVAGSPAGSESYFRRLALGVRWFPQAEGGLGARLLHAFETALRDGARHPVLIGSDSPTLPSHLLTVAHDALRTHDVVIGPADDGGYYLIGMNDAHAALFERIDWSTERVLQQTLARARDAALNVFLLPSWYDVDEAADVDRLAGDSLLRPHTRRALRQSAVEVVA